jgi:hypothetical protein
MSTEEMAVDAMAVDTIRLMRIPKAERLRYCLQLRRHLRPMLRDTPNDAGGAVAECTFCSVALNSDEIRALWPDWVCTSPTASLPEQLTALPLPRVGDSTLSYCARLPRRRFSHEAKGKLLLFPRTGHVMVPHDYQRGGSWVCVVVRGDETYPPNGHSLYVCASEIETALEVPLGAPEWPR